MSDRLVKRIYGGTWLSNQFDHPLRAVMHVGMWFMLMGAGVYAGSVGYFEAPTGLVALAIGTLVAVPAQVVLAGYGV